MPQVTLSRVDLGLRENYCPFQKCKIDSRYTTQTFFKSILMFMLEK